MFATIIAIHVIACFLLILIVLVQQGKGGGLIDTLSSAESIFGTKTNTFLVKATSVLSVVFFFTCLSLAFLSIQRNKSLMETTYPKSAKQATQQTAAAAAQTSSAPAPQGSPAPPPATAPAAPQPPPAS